MWSPRISPLLQIIWAHSSWTSMLQWSCLELLKLLKRFFYRLKDAPFPLSFTRSTFSYYFLFSYVVLLYFHFLFLVNFCFYIYIYEFTLWTWHVEPQDLCKLMKSLFSYSMPDLKARQATWGYCCFCTRWPDATDTCIQITSIILDKPRC